MGPPTTRSQARKSESWVVNTQLSHSQKQEPDAGDSASVVGREVDITLDSLSTILHEVEDSAAVHGREVKSLRDAAVASLATIRHETQTTYDRLAQEIRDNNLSLITDLNASFEAVDAHIRALPTVATLVPDSGTPRIPSFSGVGDLITFSGWLRRFEDVARMRTPPLTDEQKANLLVAYLEGVAREKIKELSVDARKSYQAIVSHLCASFEGPHQRDLARQALTSCRQEPAEASTVFANRLLSIVRAATAGLDVAAQKDRMLEEFTSRLRPDIRYFVKLERPTSFEQAVIRAQAVEQLLAEATADRLMYPSGRPAGADVSALSTPYSRAEDTTRDFNSPSDRGSFRSPPLRRGQTATPSTVCYICGGRGHFARQCPTPPEFRQGPPPRTCTQVPFSSSNRGGRTSRSPSPSDFDSGRRVRGLGRSGPTTTRCRGAQDDLEAADARVAALLERNEQLSRMAFGTTSDPSPGAAARGTGPQYFNTLMVCTVIACCMFPGGSAQPVLLCPQEPHDSLLRVPSSLKCSALFPNVSASSSVSRNVSLSLFHTNTDSHGAYRTRDRLVSCRTMCSRSKRWILSAPPFCPSSRRRRFHSYQTNRLTLDGWRSSSGARFDPIVVITSGVVPTLACVGSQRCFSFRRSCGNRWPVCGKSLSFLSHPAPG
ncbi:hypothetical protein Q1695_008626 [Nippostrongylus brasiliensis]|nr:hypothetical protein Q1695_008626 [Nippostrongylus brasiliensis]